MPASSGERPALPQFTPAPLHQPLSQHLSPCCCKQHIQLPHIPRSARAREGQQPLPHLKRRNSELMFTFPERGRRQRGGFGGGTGHLVHNVGGTVTLPAPLTFWEDVHPVPVVELLQNKVHSLLVNTISCQEKASPHQSPFFWGPLLPSPSE